MCKIPGIVEEYNYEMIRIASNAIARSSSFIRALNEQVGYQNYAEEGIRFYGLGNNFKPYQGYIYIPYGSGDKILEVQNKKPWFLEEFSKNVEESRDEILVNQEGFPKISIKFGNEFYHQKFTMDLGIFKYTQSNEGNFEPIEDLTKLPEFIESRNLEVLMNLEFKVITPHKY